MTVYLTQICDGCKRSRQLGVDLKGGRQTIENAASEGEWVEVKSGQHLCKNCINTALSQ